jgi:alcohol dehydrogenase
MKGAGKVTRFIPIPQPTLLVGPGSSAGWGRPSPASATARSSSSPTASSSKLGLLNGLTDALTPAAPEFVVFDEITPDAPIPLIERGIDFYREHDCDAIVAFGGGSAMDASKAIARVDRQPRQVAAPAGRLPQGPAHAGEDLRRAHHRRHRLGGDRGGGDLRPRAQAKLVIVDPRMVPQDGGARPA